MATIEFWYEFASPYSYFSFMRIEPLAEKAGATIKYQPFLLGPVFKQFGWDTSPFLIFKQKGDYFFRDIEREADFYNLPLKMPEQFPIHSLLAARTALIGFEKGWGVEFSKAVYTKAFGEGGDVSNKGEIAKILESLNVGDVADILAAAGAQENKQKMRDVSARAIELNIFGAPTFIVGNELYWGNDRLEKAIFS